MNKLKTLINFFKTECGAGIILLIAAILFNVIFLWSEVSIPTFQLDDEVYHQLATQEASNALRSGSDPTDFWLSQIELGYPLFHHYQHLPQVILATINRFTSLPVSRLFDFSRYILLVLFPLSIFGAMRRFGFNYLAAGFSALVSSLLSTNGLFGFDYGSYIWRGSGLYPQLWAMFFLPLALAEIYRAICQRKPVFLAIFFSAIVLLSNFFNGYILLLSTIVFVFLRFRKEEIFARFKILILFLLLLFLVTSYLFLPFLLDLKYTNTSIWIPSWKYDSFGLQKVVTDLFAGRLFDYNRLPSLTFLLFLSIVAILIFKYYRKENYRFLLIFAVFWLFLFFGRPTWGALLNLLPVSHFLQLHRLINGVHLGAIFLIGAGMSLIWEKVFQSFPRWSIIIFPIIVLAILSPAYIERIKFYEENRDWRIENQKAFLVDEEELSGIEKTLKSLPPGRVYAGLASNWGNFPNYKIGFVPIYSIFPQWGIDSFGYSYHSEALSADVRLLFDDSQKEQYNLFNIRYVLLHKTWTAPYYYSKIKEFDNYVLYEVPTTGYFDLVDAPAVFYGKATDFYYPNSKWLSSPLLGLKQYPIIELGDEPQKTFGLPVFPFQKVDEKLLAGFAQAQPEKGKIIEEEIGENKYEVQFESSRDCYLLLKSNYHPGWKAYLDGEKVQPIMLTPGFIGIKVGPGIHQALFLYKSPFYRIPLLIFGILVFILIGVWHQRILRRKEIVLDKIRNFKAKFLNLFSNKISNRSANIIASFLLISIFLMAVFSLRDDTRTSDEVPHIAAGYSYLTQQSYWLNPEHPPLIKDLAAIPLLFLNLNFPKEKSQEDITGWDFLYHSGNNPDQIIFWARIPMIFVLMFLAWFLFKWTRKLAGNLPALLVLFLFSFSPNFLAHGRLVTTDVGATLGFVISIYFYLKFLQNPTKRNTIFSGISLGIALLLKFFTLLLIPFFGLIFLIFVFLRSKEIKLKDYLKKILLIALVSISVVWIVYQFHLLNYPQEEQVAYIKDYLSYYPNTTFFNNITLWLVQNPILRPFGHYLFGFIIIFAKVVTAYAWPTYLMGTIANHGLRYYFPVVYLIKNPLALHLLTLIAFLAAVRFLEIGSLKKWLKSHFTEFSMLAFIVIYLAIAISSKCNIGIRHILPIFPFIYILVSIGIKKWINKIKTFTFKKVAIFSVLVLLIWYGVSSLSVSPNYLAYFNELVGGSKHGYEYVVDSNVDAGQDLRRLAKWVEKQGIDKIYIDYFSDDPRDEKSIPKYYLGEKAIPWRGSSIWVWWGIPYPGSFPKGNYLAVSATLLQTDRGKPRFDYQGYWGYYNWLNNYQPIAQVGRSILVYYIP